MAAKKLTGFDEVNDKLDRVIDTMATKDDLMEVEKRLDNKIDGVIDAMVTYEDVAQLEERLEQKIDKRIGEVLTAIDRLAKVVGDLALEYAAVKNQLARHEEWIHVLAKKAKVKLGV